MLKRCEQSDGIDQLTDAMPNKEKSHTGMWQQRGRERNQAGKKASIEMEDNACFWISPATRSEK